MKKISIAVLTIMLAGCASSRHATWLALCHDEHFFPSPGTSGMTQCLAALDQSVSISEGRDRRVLAGARYNPDAHVADHLAVHGDRLVQKSRVRCRSRGVPFDVSL